MFKQVFIYFGQVNYDCKIQTKQIKVNFVLVYTVLINTGD